MMGPHLTAHNELAVAAEKSSRRPLFWWMRTQLGRTRPAPIVSLAVSVPHPPEPAARPRPFRSLPRCTTEKSYPSSLFDARCRCSSFRRKAPKPPSTQPEVVAETAQGRLWSDQVRTASEARGRYRRPHSDLDEVKMWIRSRGRPRRRSRPEMVNEEESPRAVR